MTARRVWSRDAGGDRGAVIPFVALALVTLIIMTAFSLDIGRQILRRREAQAVADVTALDLSRLVNGRSALAITTDPKWATTKSEAATRNNWVNTQLVPELGLWDAASGTFTSMGLGSAGVPNAVRVTATDTVNFFFAGVIGINNGDVSRSSVATNGAQACISVGSYAAALNGNPTSLLGALLGNALGASVVGYTGLANAQVNLGDIAAQLGFGTPSQLLTSSVNTKQFIIAEANALGASGDTANATLLNNIATGVNGSSSFSFGSLVSVQQGSEQDALDTAFNALDLLSGAAFLANGTNAISVPTASLSLPAGVSNLTASVKVIENPQTGCGSVNGPPVQTSQITLTLDFNVTVLLSVYSVHITLDGASATATLIAPLSCGPPAQATINVSSALVTTAIRQTLLGVPLTVTTNQTTGGNVVSFTIPTDTYNTMKHSGSGSIGLANSTVTGLNPTVILVLNNLFTTLDAALMKPLSQAVGIDVAGADVEVLPSIKCDAIKLTQ